MKAGISVVLYITSPSCLCLKTYYNMDFHYVYVLFSDRDHKLYIGYSKNVHHRLDNTTGLNTSTAPRRPFLLIYFEAHLLASDALRREAYFKTSSGKRTLQITGRSWISKVTIQSLREGGTKWSPSLTLHTILSFSAFTIASPFELT